mgnify:CR=1 FL=1
MKLGIITSIFDGWTFEEMIDEVSRIGYETIEVASWPQGKAERRYAGVTHVDAERVLEDDAYAQHLLDYAAEHHVQIGALAYYPNNMDADLERRRVCNEHLVNVIHAAKKLGGKIDFVDAVRFEKGEGIEKKQENFAEEIASMIKG